MNVAEKGIYPELYEKISSDYFKSYKQKISRYSQYEIQLLAEIYWVELDYESRFQSNSDDISSVINEVRHILCLDHKDWISHLNLTEGALPKIHLQMFPLVRIPLYITIESKFLKALVNWRLRLGI